MILVCLLGSVGLFFSLLVVKHRSFEGVNTEQGGGGGGGGGENKAGLVSTEHLTVFVRSVA